MQPRSQSLIYVFKIIAPRLILSPLHSKMNVKRSKDAICYSAVRGNS